MPSARPTTGRHGARAVLVMVATGVAVSGYTGLGRPAAAGDGPPPPLALLPALLPAPGAGDRPAVPVRTAHLLMARTTSANLVAAGGPLAPPGDLPTPRPVPDAPAPLPVPAIPVPPTGPPPTPAPAPVPKSLPAPAPGRVEVGGTPLSVDAFAQLVGQGDSLAAVTPLAGGGCATCGDGPGGCGGGKCLPGRDNCEPLPRTGPVMRVLGAVYDAVTCPDPCYQGRWEPVANSAFYVDGARPIAQFGFQYDYWRQVQHPDRGEYIWARADGKGKGPAPSAGVLGEPRLDENILTQFTEVGGPTFTTTIRTPYVGIDPRFAPSAAGFGNISISTKSLLVDTDLFLMSLEFTTTVPSGNFSKGLGNGHVSLEPGLVGGVRVSPASFLQVQLAEWIPLGGDPNYQGSLIRYGLSYNHILWRPVKNFQVIGNIEGMAYTFQHGQYTDRYAGPYQGASGQTLLQVGPGVRVFFADKLDFGIGTAFGAAKDYLAKDQLQLSLRYRY